MTYSDLIGDAVDQLLRTWHKVSVLFLAAIERSEGQGYEVEGATKLRECRRSVRGMVTPDDEFFAGPAAGEMADAAVAANRAGETLAWED